MTISADTSIQDQVLVSVGGLPTCTRTYTSPSPEVSGWSGTDGWAGTGASVSAGADGLIVTVTGSSGYVAKSHASVSGSDNVRVRARVRLLDPETRPVKVRISDQSGTFGAPPLFSGSDWSTLIGGTPVWIEGWMPRFGTTSIRVNVYKPAGATQAAVVVEAITWDVLQAGAETWQLFREDDNGTALLADMRQDYAFQQDSAGAVDVVDREPALAGDVTYRLVHPGDLDQVDTVQVDASGGAVLHLVHAYAPTLHQLSLGQYGGAYQGVAQPNLALGGTLPSVPAYPLSGREGRLVYLARTLDAAELVAQDLRTGRVAMSRTPEPDRRALDLYLVARGVSVDAVLEDADGGPYWSVSVDYVETTRGTW